MALATLSSPPDGGQEAPVPAKGTDDDEPLLPVAEGERELGRYHLRYEIASGGMATVYLARVRGPAGFERPVAIKRIHPHLAKKREFVEMFLDEARLSARISHPNVCSVFDFGEVEGSYFMAMEYVVGQPVSGMLRALSRRADLADSPRWRAMAIRIVADACEGLHAAHELKDERGELLGVVHRDFTPQNVFVTYDGAVKVVDFGIARAAGRLHQTQTGNLKGKIAYMSPEQVQGEPYDRRLDVWAAGVCLWEMLTVQRMFGKRSEVELLQAVVSEPIPRPSAVRPGISPELDAIVMRALERDPAKRTPSARALATELHRVLAFAGVSASLGEASELMRDLFGTERAAELGVVADVLTPLVPADRLVGPELAETTDPVSSSELPSRHAVSPRLEPVPSADSSPRAASFALPAQEPASAAARTGPSWPVVVVAVLGAVVALGGLVYSRGRGGEVVADAAHGDSRVVVSSTMAPAPTAPPSPAPPQPTGAPIERRATEAAAARSSGATGTLQVAARGGWADVYVDGERVGRTPRRLVLAVGEHAIDLRPQGRLPAISRTVDVLPGQTERMSVEVGRAPSDVRSARRGVGGSPGAPHRHWPGVGLAGPRPSTVR